MRAGEALSGGGRRFGSRARMSGAALAMAVIGLAGTAAGADDGAASLGARATAEGIRIGLGMPDFVVVEQFVDGGGPVAEAATDSLGTSRSFASLPYPGELFIGGPPTVAGLLGLPSPPSYPFHVQASYPSEPESSFGQDGWRLVARSDDRSAQAVAAGGASSKEAAVLSARAEATAERDPATGAATASALSAAEGFRITGAITIGRAVATARVARSSVSSIERSSTFEVAGLTIAGQAVGVSGDGLVTGGQGTPLPPSDPLLKALAGQGITITYVAPTEQPDGITSAGLIIRQTLTLPSGHVMRISYTLGRAQAEVVSQSFDSP